MKHLLFVLLLGLSSVALSSQSSPWDVPNPEPPNECELKGGRCVAVVPDSCRGGRITKDACGPEGIVGVQCCMAPGFNAEESE